MYRAYFTCLLVVDFVGHRRPKLLQGPLDQCPRFWTLYDKKLSKKATAFLMAARKGRDR
ncbi:hypothetical protein HK096_002318, partial [Nowakowskiella sp. JEL0078]